MKPKLYILFFTLLLSVSLFAQGRKEKVEALRVAFITQKLNLTADESQKFWPAYNEYVDKVKAARQEFRRQSNDFITDKQAQDYLDAELLLKQRELALYKEYYERFKKVLPLKKVAALREAEEDFKKELLKQLQGKNE